MFRDPSFYIAFREKVVPALARIRSPGSGWQAARPARRSTRSRSCSRRSRSTTGHASMRRTSTNRPRTGASGRVPARQDARVHAELHQGRRNAGVFGVLPRKIRRRPVPALADRERRLRPAQPRLGPLVQRVQRDHLPERDDLFRPHVAGPRPPSSSSRAWSRSVCSGSGTRSRSASARTKRATRSSTRTRSSTERSTDREVRPGVHRRSWGGLKAVGRCSGTCQPSSTSPIAIAQHRHRDSHAETLAELLRTKTKRPVLDVEDKMPIEPHHVYVAPPNYHLLVERGSFALSVDEHIQFARPSIDVLFETAADAYGAGVIGIILTGANADGALGLARIKNARRRGSDPGSARRGSPDACRMPLSPRPRPTRSCRWRGSGTSSTGCGSARGSARRRRSDTR